MNESTKSTPLLTWLRLHAPKSVVIKHCDRATIGIPDASVTYLNITMWLEFKFYRPNKNWTGEIDFEAIAQKHPAQYEVTKRLAAAGKCYYVVWVAKHKLIGIWNPLTKDWYAASDIGTAGQQLLELHVGGGR